MRSAPSSIACAIGVLLATPPSISSRPSRSTVGKDAGDGGACDDRRERVALREAKLLSAEEIGGDHVKRDRGVLEVVDPELLGDQTFAGPGRRPSGRAPRRTRRSRSAG